MTSTALATTNDIDKTAILKSLNLNPADPKTAALLLVCDRYDLDPLLKHMVLIQGNPYVTRDGYLAIAHKSGVFDGMEVLEQGDDQTHYIAKVAVYRKDMGRPFTFVGRFPKSKNMAKEYGPEMAVKVAEVQALRRAFNVTGVGAADERWDEQAQPVEATPPQDIDGETGEIIDAVVRRPSPLQLPATEEAEEVAAGPVLFSVQDNEPAPTLPRTSESVPTPGKAETPAPKKSKAVESMVKSIKTEAAQKGMTDIDVSAVLEESAGVRSLDELTDTKSGPAIFAALGAWG